MTQANVEKLAKSLIKRYDVFGKKNWDEFLGFNIPDVCGCREIYDFINKHKCSYNINVYGILFIYKDLKVYKVE